MTDSGSGWLQKAKTWARSIKRDVVALWIAARDRRVPWYAKLAAGCVAAYALSPIDLIPDFIPVLGYLDDIILVPLGIMLAVRLIPAPLMVEFRALAAAREGRPMSRFAAAVVIVIWLISAALLIWAFWLRRA
ncbi:membrane protein [Devosia psychrophila]|uniref:Membrane protein n=1 Tax=Devosia psychrophila TaxID=728005 RepID=A0ABR5DT33_9HYPH|nr:YkvA family protein [Devosia psychrophila]KKC31167.1 membrane protein [Devosia psychrophila]